MAIVDENLVDGGELKQARRKMLRAQWRQRGGAALAAMVLAMLIVVLLELVRVDSEPLGLLGRFAEFPDGRVVAAHLLSPQDFAPGAVRRGNFYVEVQCEVRGISGILYTSMRFTSTTFTVTDKTNRFAQATLSNSQIPADSPYRQAVGDLILRDGYDDEFQRAWFRGVPFADSHYFSACLTLFFMTLPICLVFVWATTKARYMRRIAKGRCGGCAYDLSGSQGTTRCPECGAEVVETSDDRATEARGEPRG